MKKLIAVLLSLLVIGLGIIPTFAEAQPMPDEQEIFAILKEQTTAPDGSVSASDADEILYWLPAYNIDQINEYNLPYEEIRKDTVNHTVVLAKDGKPIGDVTLQYAGGHWKWMESALYTTGNTDYSFEERLATLTEEQLAEAMLIFTKLGVSIAYPENGTMVVIPTTGSYTGLDAEETKSFLAEQKQDKLTLQQLINCSIYAREQSAKEGLDPNIYGGGGFSEIAEAQKAAADYQPESKKFPWGIVIVGVAGVIAVFTFYFIRRKKA